jgi:hypothetical protein
MLSLGLCRSYECLSENLRLHINRSISSFNVVLEPYTVTAQLIHVAKAERLVMSEMPRSFPGPTGPPSWKGHAVSNVASRRVTHGALSVFMTILSIDRRVQVQLSSYTVLSVQLASLSLVAGCSTHSHTLHIENARIQVEDNIAL